MLVVKKVEDQHSWDSFIESVAPDTFLQSWQWAEFNEKVAATPTRLGIYNDDRLVAVALLLTVRARRGTFLLCPHGPVIAHAADTALVMTALTDELKKIAEKQGASFIRIAPLLSDTPEHNSIFKKMGYRNAPVHMVHPELAWILDTTADEAALLHSMRKSTRYSIKKAEKEGVTITTSTRPEDFELFWKVYEQTAKRQHFTAFTKNFLQAEFEVFSKKNAAMFFFAHFKNEITATAFIVFDHHSGYYHHGATTQKYSGLTDAQLLQWEVIKECKRRGLKKYNFWGVVPEHKKKHPWNGLSTFKRGFGGYKKEYVHAKDLSLSSRYWVTYIIERLRRFKRGL